MTVSHDLPSYREWSTEAIQQKIARTKVYMLMDRGWKVGPGVLAQLHAELRERGVE